MKGASFGPSSLISFAVTDQAHSVQVAYNGILPDLFREEQGVVTEGTLRADGVFVADSGNSRDRLREPTGSPSRR